MPAADNWQVSEKKETRATLSGRIDDNASIRASIGKLELVTTYNLPVKVVVLDNTSDGMVKQWQKLFFKGRLPAADKLLHKKDFIKTAQADGFEYAERLRDPADVTRVVEAFLNLRGPAFPEVMIEQNAGVYPMAGPGKSYKEMITGDYINNRYDPSGGEREIGASEMFQSRRLDIVRRKKAGPVGPAFFVFA